MNQLMNDNIITNVDFATNNVFSHDKTINAQI